MTLSRWLADHFLFWPSGRRNSAGGTLSAREKRSRRMISLTQMPLLRKLLSSSHCAARARTPGAQVVASRFAQDVQRVD
jgi:hypothetical protein